MWCHIFLKILQIFLNAISPFSYLALYQILLFQFSLTQISKQECIQIMGQLRIAVPNKWLYHTSKCHDFFPLIKIYLINLNHSISLDQPLLDSPPGATKSTLELPPLPRKISHVGGIYRLSETCLFLILSTSARVTFKRWHLQVAWDTMPVSCIGSSTLNEVFFKL